MSELIDVSPAERLVVARERLSSIVAESSLVHISKIRIRHLARSALSLLQDTDQDIADRIRAAVAAEREACIKLTSDLDRCAHCHDNNATCVGRYKNEDSPWEPACDECCGHGNEDGRCRPVAEHIAAAIRARGDGSIAAAPDAVKLAIECLRWMGHSDDCRHHEDGPDTCDCGSDELRFRALAALKGDK